MDRELGVETLQDECHNILHIISGEYSQVLSLLSSVPLTLGHVSINIDL